MPTGIVNASHKGIVNALPRGIVGALPRGIVHALPRGIVGALPRGIVGTPYRGVVDQWRKEMDALLSRIVPLPFSQTTHTHSSPVASNSVVTMRTQAVHTQFSPVAHTQSSPVAQTRCKGATHARSNPVVPTHSWLANDDNLIIMSRTITGVWVDQG